MKIKDILDGNKTIFSFEFFPPKTDEGEKNLFFAVKELEALKPDYVSVTYGALGATQDKSLRIIEKIKAGSSFNVMAHYTCIGTKRSDADIFLAKLKELGIENILALRGDLPGGEGANIMEMSDFKYAVDLVKYIKSSFSDFSVGVAGYPEGHPEAPSLDADIARLKDKIESGADFIITQLFFDNGYFFNYTDKVRKYGIDVPVIPGIMPLENFKQIEKIVSMCGATIPPKLRDVFSDTNMSLADKAKYGIEYTIYQCRELLENGVCGLHFYTLNKSKATVEIFRNLGK